MDVSQHRPGGTPQRLTDLGRYVVEEWAEEYREGHLGRREFLRRIGVFAGGAALGGGVLTAVGITVSPEELEAAAAAAPAVPPLRAQAPVVPPNDPGIRAQMTSYPSGAVSVIAYAAQPAAASKAPGILVIHENRGLLPHHMDVARRLAKAGYVALAPDLASPAGGTAKFSDPAEVTAFLGRTPPEDLVAMLDGGVRRLAALPAVRSDRLGAIGFCFGGGLAWRLAMANPDLRAVIPFYGPNPPLGDVSRIRAAILAIYGGLDQRVDAGIPAMREALTDAGVVHEIVIEPGANHAFFNDTGPAYNAAAAADAWPRVLAWFGEYLSGA